MIHISAPRKLMISGEWAVLEFSPCIVSAINKRVHAQIEDSNEISVNIDNFNIKNVKAEFDGKNLIWKSEISNWEKEKLIFIKCAIETSLRYLEERNRFKIRTWNEQIDDITKKIGFGSSSASVVSTVAGLLKFNGFDIDTKKSKNIIYKLSSIAHYFAQNRVGSAFDIAASTYGGIIVYKRFDPKWLTNELKRRTLKEIVNRKWKGFYIEKLKIPDNFILLIGWTGKSAHTPSMIKRMKKFKKTNPEEYEKVYKKISNLVHSLIMAWKNENRGEILKMLRRNEDYIRDLGEKSNIDIETAELKKMSELANKCGASGKLSGAGGGDCGIAVCFDKKVAEKVKYLWKKNGLHIVNADIDGDGVRNENSF